MRVPSSRDIGVALTKHQTAEDFSLPGRTNHIMAATLIPLRWDPDLTVIATVRNDQMRQHPGEVCFPGGTPESTDKDLQQTALREAAEELGITGPEVLGTLSRIPVYTSEHRITPYVAAIASTPLRPAPQEVASIIEISVLDILQRPTIEGLPFQINGEAAWSPIFHLSGHIMYGATAHSFVELLEVLAPLYELNLPPYALGETQWSDVLPPGVTL